MLVFYHEKVNNNVMAGAQQGVTFALENKQALKQKRAPGGRATAGKTRLVNERVFPMYNF